MPFACPLLVQLTFDNGLELLYCSIFSCFFEKMKGICLWACRFTICLWALLISFNLRHYKFMCRCQPVLLHVFGWFTWTWWWGQFCFMLGWWFVSISIVLLSFFHYIVLGDLFVKSSSCLKRLTGTSGPCDTFGNLCLAHSTEFELKNVEVIYLLSLYRLHIHRDSNTLSSLYTMHWFCSTYCSNIAFLKLWFDSIIYDLFTIFVSCAVVGFYTCYTRLRYFYLDNQ